MEFRPNYYEILQVDQKAGPEVITAAYNELLSKNSSENCGNEELIHLIREAYAVISNPQDRFMYDSWLSANDCNPHHISNITPNQTASTGDKTEYLYQQVPKLSVIDAYKFGFEMVVKQPVITLYYLGFSLLMGFLTILINPYYWQSPSEVNLALLLLIIPLSLILGTVVFSIINKLILNIFDNKEIEINSLTSIRIIANLIVFLLLFIIIVSIGFVFLIIPGIILLLKLIPGFYLIIDEDLGALDALKKSWQITKGFKWKAFLFGLVYVAFSSLVSLFLWSKYALIFVVITTAIGPILFYSVAYFYRMLLYQTQAHDLKDIKSNAYSYNHPRLNESPTFILVIAVIILLVINLYFQKSYLDKLQPYSNNNMYSTETNSNLPYVLPSVSTEMTRYTIPQIGSIDLPNSMKLYSEENMQTLENYENAVGLPVSEKSFFAALPNDTQKYCVVLVDSIPGRPGDYAKLTDNFGATESEIAMLSEQTMDIMRNQIEQVPGNRMLEWYPPKVENINGMTAVIFSFKRQLADKPPVLVWEYRFQNFDRIIILTISYRENERNYWQPLLDRSLNTFRITNII